MPLLVPLLLVLLLLLQLLALLPRPAARVLEGSWWRSGGRTEGGRSLACVVGKKREATPS